jgi:predicted nucleic acid-binding protein
VLSRSRFDRFAPFEERLSFTGSVAASGQLIDLAYQSHACEYPKDDKFLDLAYAAGADRIISGDRHLRTLKHFMGIQIWLPAQFVARERRVRPDPASRTQRD